MEVTPACANVSSVVVPFALVTRMRKLLQLVSEAFRTPSWLVSNTSCSACMSVLAAGSHRVKSTWLAWVTAPPLGS